MKLGQMQNISARQYFQNGSGMATLCGSTRFFPEYMEANRALTVEGWVVLTCGILGHSYHKDAEQLSQDSSVKRLHFHKILESDAIVVVSDKTLYYGESTTEEIAFAKYRQKPVYYFDGESLNGWNMIREIPDRYADSSLIENFRQSIKV